MQVAIDGPSGSGKSTAARLLARRMDYLYIDTGAMYRAVTLECVNNSIDIEDHNKVIEVAENLGLEIAQDWNMDRGYRIYIDEREITEKLFTSRVDENVSRVARIKQVRQIMVERQRRLARNNDVVMAGRDIGSNVLPGAPVKIFLIASAAERAQRRQQGLEEKGEKKDFKEILEIIQMRDKIDSTRTENPLVKTSDAIEVDNTRMSIIEMVDTLENIVRKKIN